VDHHGTQGGQQRDQESADPVHACKNSKAWYSARITAIALNLHDPGLMDKLVEEWAKLKEKPQVLIDARDEYRRPGDELKRKLDEEEDQQRKLDEGDQHTDSSEVEEPLSGARL
jgi:hypothetical protein